MLKVTWLGQAGLLFEKDDCKIVIDPYLSDSCCKVNPSNRRRVPINKEFLTIPYDIAIFTHNHMDHFDVETCQVLLRGDNPMLVLAPETVWAEARKLGSNNNYVKFDRHTSWSEKGIIFTAVKAEHSDERAIGVIIDDGDKKYYITGDTLYNEEIFKDIPNDIDVLFLPVNGVGNNMNFKDAERFAKRISAKKTVPLHIGMFDDKTADGLMIDHLVIPTVYQTIKIEKS